MTKPILTRGLIITPFTNAIVEDGNVHRFNYSNTLQDICCANCSLREKCADVALNSYLRMCRHFIDLNSRFSSGYFKKVKFRLNRASGHIEGKA